MTHRPQRPIRRGVHRIGALVATILAMLVLPLLFVTAMAPLPSSLSVSPADASAEDATAFVMKPPTTPSEHTVPTAARHRVTAVTATRLHRPSPLFLPGTFGIPGASRSWEIFDDRCTIPGDHASDDLAGSRAPPR